MINIAKLTNKVLAGGEISHEDAESITRLKGSDLIDLYTGANKIRERYHGNQVDLCSVLNSKSGNCKEDCRFCAQSVKYDTIVEEYSLMDKSEILKVAENAYNGGARRFCISTSGKRLSKAEVESVCEAIIEIKRKTSLYCCATLGELGADDFKMLKEAGLDRFHHNIETSKTYFSKICSTHTFDERLETIEHAGNAGLSMCVGVIIGMGESSSDWVEMAMAIKELDVDSIPINFLMPIPGTPMQNLDTVEPSVALKIISLFRFINPTKEIRVCGGRVSTLKDLTSFVFLAGADGMMIGNYLTSIGRKPELDIAMIKDLNMDVEELIH